MKFNLIVALIFLCLHSTRSYSKDNFLLSFMVTRAQDAERFNQVDQKSFNGERTGFGLLLESERIKSLSFETGLLKAARQYTVKDDGKIVAEQVDRLHAPIGLKYHLINNFALGIGGYASYAVSKKERAIESSASSSETTSANDDEYGIQYFFSGHYPIRTTDLILDLRYFEPSVSKNDEETNNFLISLGARFRI